MIVLSLSLSMMALTACQGKRGASTASGLNRVHFDTDRASIRPDMAKVLDANASYLKSHPKLKVTVEGNCDERGTNEYNLALGERRADAAKDYLTNRGVSDSRLKTVSYGEEHPLQKGHNEAAWYMNRRDDFTRR